tara:strand:- start:14 stop:1969 length:1956 start_codon:yes stop_codon:yes gene_type:complete
LNYEDFLRRKQAVDLDTGIANVPSLNSGLFDFQHAVTSWALRRGRAAVFAGTGMGKSFMEMEWAKQVNEYTGKPVLILTPLAVSGQFIDEGEKFGIEIHQAKEQSDVRNGIYVTNYEKMQHFDMSAFGGVVLDESSILKSFTGKTRNMLIEECQVVPFRLAATATPAPNDFMEIGNHAEFLGVMNYTEMLAMFFVHDGGETQKWRLKGHAQSEFWQWMSTWSVMFQHPRDIGYETEGYDLPNLNIIQHTVGVDYDQNDLSTLFPMEAHTMQERITARKETIEERCKKAVDVICNYEIMLQSGVFSNKLAECLGNQNTQKTDERNMHLAQKSASAEGHNQDQVTKTKSTCENTTLKTKKTGTSEHQNNQKNTTNQEGKDTNQILSLEKNANNKQDQDVKTKKETKDLGQLTVLDNQNTRSCLINKQENAKYADHQKSGESQNTSKLTIVTEQEELGDCCATGVISDLVNSKTIQKSSGKLPNTLSIQTPWVIWCNLNDEQDKIARYFGDQCISIRGADSEDQKEKKLISFKNQEKPILVTKTSICGVGLNLQHCSNTCFVGLNDSYEQVYQAIRRFYRFGQKSAVNAHFIAAETEGQVVKNIERKEKQFLEMQSKMIEHMKDLNEVNAHGSLRNKTKYENTINMKLPTWIGG